jgi:hypothetical protein
MKSEILHPVAALALWTMIVWVWMYATRIPAINKLPKTGAAADPKGWTGAMLDELLPREVQWKAHNYNHLHEAPTVFYAVALLLAFVGQGDGLNATIAWVYVGLRILHSLIQALYNAVVPRFLVFLLSSLALMMLVVHAYLAVIHQ